MRHLSSDKCVHSGKPAHRSDTAFTDKTGGCKDDASAVGRTYIYKPASAGNLGIWKVTGCADFTAIQNLLVRMRKGSIIVRAVASKSFYAVLVVRGISMTLIAKNRLVSGRRKTVGDVYCVSNKICSI